MYKYNIRVYIYICIHIWRGALKDNGMRGEVEPYLLDTNYYDRFNAGKRVPLTYCVCLTVHIQVARQLHASFAFLLHGLKIQQYLSSPMPCNY